MPGFSGGRITVAEAVPISGALQDSPCSMAIASSSTANASSMTTASSMPGPAQPGVAAADFTFPKIPVTPYQPKSTQPLDGRPVLKLQSNISSILPSRCLAADRTPSATLASPHPHVLDIDYNDHIRFPRISNLRNYVYAQAPRKLLVGQTSVPAPAQCLPPNSSYTPAMFDLSAPLRRFSLPESSPLDASIVDYMADNEMYLRDLHQSIPHHDSRRGLELSGKWSTTSLYEMKRPVALPAALRPITSNSSSQLGIDTHIPEHLKNFKVTLDDDARSQSLDSNDNTTLRSGAQQSADTLVRPPSLRALLHLAASRSRRRLVLFVQEPTHRHWQPNLRANNHCMRCLRSFRNALVSRICSWFDASRLAAGGKHHCRFCGVIVCRDCLAQSEESQPGSHGAIVLDQNARFVVPMHTRELENPLSNPHNFRLFKVCKHCSQMYNHVLNVLNEQAAARAPDATTGSFVFIENPHLSTDALDAASRHVSPACAPQKRLSVIEDWTWSSF